MKDIECPYCEADQDINHDDGYGYGEDEVYKQECSICGKTFTYTTSIIFHYYTEQAECQNGGEHDWEPTTTIPRWATRMRCTMCDESRQPTQEEKEKFGLL